MSKEHPPLLLPPRFIEANAGSGKTYALQQLIMEAVGKGFDPQKILAITFTRAAAWELKQRIAHLPTVTATTIHAFCWQSLASKLTNKNLYVGGQELATVDRFLSTKGPSTCLRSFPVAKGCKALSSRQRPLAPLPSGKSFPSLPPTLMTTSKAYLKLKLWLAQICQPIGSTFAVKT